MATPTKFAWSSGFAQKQLEKHGWKEGKGLGKEESGISDPIKVKLKHDTAGVGHDLGEQFTYHWWDHVFNKAADNIVVETDEDEVKVKQKGDNSKLISNKKQHTYTGNKTLLYGNFVKSATLTEDGEEPEAAANSSDDDEGEPATTDADDRKGKTNRDEEFFKACGGRTAHKGARHGLKQNGKLRRIQEQESLFIQASKPNLKNVSDCVPVLENSTDTCETIKKRKKKRKEVSVVANSAEAEGDFNEELPSNITGDEFKDGEFTRKLRKSKKCKKSKRTVNETIDGSTLVEEDTIKIEKRISEQDDADNVMVTSDFGTEKNESCNEPRKKKKKRKKSKSKPKM